MNLIMTMAASSALFLFCAFDVALANPPSCDEQEQIALFSDVRSLFRPASDGVFENRVGFSIASLDIDEFVHRPGEEEPSLPGTQDRLRNFAQILLRHPTTRVHIDAHTGTTAPPMIAQEYSEMRAQIVARALQDLGVPEELISTAAWGMTIAHAAATSAHPNSASGKSGFGWVELFITFKSSSGKDVVLPPRPDYYADLPPGPHSVVPETDQITSAESSMTSMKIAAFLSPQFDRQNHNENIEAQSVFVVDVVDVTDLLGRSTAKQAPETAVSENTQGETSETIFSHMVQYVTEFVHWMWPHDSIQFLFQWYHQTTSPASTKAPVASASDSRIGSNEASEKPWTHAIKDAFITLEGKAPQLIIPVASVAILLSACCVGYITSRQEEGESKQPLLQVDSGDFIEL